MDPVIPRRQYPNAGPVALAPAGAYTCLSMRDLQTAHRILCGISALALALLSPTPLSLVSLHDSGLLPASYPSAARPLAPLHDADLDGDGQAEQIVVRDGRASIVRGPQTLWSSDAAWQVTQAQTTDLNRDGQLELALLVWRPFAPWPIDTYLPHPGRLASFQDGQGRSCHLILFGWRRQAFRELWAGSALADPLISFSAADLDDDGYEELIALEGRYDAPSAAAGAVTLWAWNGFGFTLQARNAPGRYHGFAALHPNQGPDLLLVDGAIWR